LKRAWTERLRHVAVTRAVAVKALIGVNEFWNQKSANCPHQKFCAPSVAVYALPPIVGLYAGLPAKDRAKGTLIFRASRARMIEAIGIPDRFARVGFVVSGVVLGRRGGICDRRDNQSRANHAKDRGSHYGGEN
jgi:hypothetical protein